MSFIYPYFLYALTALSIPILIHLLNFKSFKVVYFSNVRFLQNIQKETRSRSSLKHWLVLLMRLLAVATLVLAFAQPFIPHGTENKGAKTDLRIFVYVDNSFSMNAEGESGNLIEMAKNKARSIVNAYNANAKFLLLTNDFKPSEQHFMNKEQVLENIGKIVASPQTRHLKDVFMRQSDFMMNADGNANGKNAGSAFFYVVSDFQKSTAAFKELKPIEGLSYQLVPVYPQNSKNLYIDSIWFDVPARKINQNEQLNVRIVNTSKEVYKSLPIKLYLADTVKAVGSYSIDGRSMAVVQLNYTNTHSGNINGRVEISDYPIVHDNTYFFSYTIDANIKLLYIGKQASNPYIKVLFGQDEYVKLTETTQQAVRPSDFISYRAIILDECDDLPSAFVQSLLRFVEGGGSVVFIPNAKANLSIYNGLLAAVGADQFSSLDTAKIQLTDINLKNELYRSAFSKIDQDAKMPMIRKHFKTLKGSRSANQAILTAQNKDELLSMLAYGKGKLYLFSFPINAQASDFGEHPLFIPTLYNMVLYSQVSNRISYTIGKDETVELFGMQNDERNLLHVSDQTKSVDFIPQHFYDLMNSSLKINISGNIKHAGHFILQNKDSIVKNISFNYNREESETECYPKDSLSSLVGRYKTANFNVLTYGDDVLSAKIKEQDQGTKLWKYFIVMAILFLALEIVVARFFDDLVRWGRKKEE